MISREARGEVEDGSSEKPDQTRLCSNALSWVYETRCLWSCVWCTAIRVGLTRARGAEIELQVERDLFDFGLLLATDSIGR